jgi:hypothetical protein
VFDVSFQDIVTEDHANLIAFRKVFRQAESIRNAAFPFLIGVVQMLQAEFLAVAEQPQKVSGVPPTRDDEDLLNPGTHKCPERIVDHRGFVDGQQVLVRDFGQRIEPRTCPPCQDHTFQLTPLLALARLLKNP